jgi:hypothetical protein
MLNFVLTPVVFLIPAICATLEVLGFLPVFSTLGGREFHALVDVGV